MLIITVLWVDIHTSSVHVVQQIQVPLQQTGCLNCSCTVADGLLN